MDKIDDQTAKLYMCELSNWAKYKCQGLEEPPWTFYRYMQLAEATDSIIEGMSSIKIYDLPNLKKEDLPQQDESQEKHLRLVGGKCGDPSNSRPHPDIISVNLPM